ncbi:MAG: DEAD/DEAH box helicase family protein [Paraglaciecola sp.]|nr:DEAD/DEAH box helicase family protein [Paraglaciecola sp.]
MVQQLFQGKVLTTGGANDPLLPKLLTAINHATEVEISVSFIQPSGLQLLLPALTDALIAGAKIKILTSDYLHITSPEALRQLLLLCEQGAQVKLFCCQANTPFHMKAYIFVKGYEGVMEEGCAYIGSNNISRTALLNSHEWTLRHDFQQKYAVECQFTDIRQQFAAIFSHPQSQPLTEARWAAYLQRYQQNKQQRLQLVDAVIEEEPRFTPNEAQMLALAALTESRQQGYKRGLVVLATGMGKTWLAAFDAKQLAAKRVLFVAHREEILLQAQQSFSQLNPNKSSGLYLGSEKAPEADLLFASIQTLSKVAHLQQFKPDHFDYVVVDEFHHAASPSYQALLHYFTPEFLLGLTATPERSDQADILALCDNNLVFERNLVHGIESRILVPFHYYGIYDQFVDYQEIPWRSGKFDPKALDSAFATRKRTAHIFEHWQKHKQQRTLAFCVSRRHADYMAEYFNAQGIAAAAVYQGSALRRNEALSLLQQAQLSVLFSVDLFNEGTDLPAIDTVLMLRPTESKILFLQQLGRGLRQAEHVGKTHLVVLDFIGNHQSFLNKPAALYNVSGVKAIISTLAKQPVIAPGCYINFAPEVINVWQQLVRNMKNTAAEDFQQLQLELGHRPTAAEFVLAGFDIKKVRDKHGSWFNLVAGQTEDAEMVLLLERYGSWLREGVETTGINKCFKMILLRAFLALDGFSAPVSTHQLAKQSRQQIWRRPDLVEKDVPAALRQDNNSEKWHQYWYKNPIHFYAKQDKAASKPWFVLNAGRFAANFEVRPADIEALTALTHELIDLRLAQYLLRDALV